MVNKELWWHEYRRRKHQRRRVINVENALRGIMKKCLREYISNCCIPGIRQLNDPDITIKERILWVIVFGFMIGIAIYFFLYLWFESLSNPLIVSLESSSYPISKIDFPAVAICNINRISKKASIAFEMKTFNKTAPKDLTEMKTWQLGRLLDFSYHETVKTFLLEQFIQHGSKYADRIIGGMKELAPRCEDMLLFCMWAGKLVDCQSIFFVRRTIRGHCCAFNYVLDYNAAGMPNKTISEVKQQSRPGTRYGLNLIIDPLIEDYAYTTRYIHGIEILLFDPTHFADPTGGRVAQRVAEPNMATFLELDSIKQHASREVRYYNLGTRRCLFRDERQEKFNNMYSYSACIVECRIKTVQALCRCTPYFLPTSSDMPTCTLYDLECLNKYKEKLYFMFPVDAESDEGLEIEFLESLYCPDCLPDCEFTKHNTNAMKIPIPQSKTSQDFMKMKFSFPSNINMTSKCFVSIYQSTFYGTLDRLDVVSYWYELVSSVGGVGGILLGLSIMSIFELIYYFVIKFLSLIIHFLINSL